MTDPPSTHAPLAPLGATAHTTRLAIALLRWTRWSAAVVGGLVLLVLWAGPNLAPAVSVRTRASSALALDVMPVKPGGPAQNHAAFLPTTTLIVPAHTMITLVIRNFDLDAAPMPAAYLRVTGTAGGVAYVNGAPYTSVSRDNLAHTFTIPALNINVPIPAHSSANKPYVSVTFHFRTGASGTLTWKCSAPCGEGPDGQDGPMADDAYMRGTLLVRP